MQKIILKTIPGCKLKNFISEIIYLGAFSAATYVCYVYTSPLITLQVLMSWVIIYNSALLVFGTPPKIDNIYFLVLPGESRFFHYLDGSHQKFSLFSELFVFYASLVIFAHNRILIVEIPNVTNLFTLTLSIYYWRKLFFLLRGIYSYGQQSLNNSMPHNYEQQGRHSKLMLYILLSIATLVFYSLYCFDVGQQNSPRPNYMFLPYILVVSSFGIMQQETGVEIIPILFVTILTILQFHFTDTPYSLVLFLLFLAILIIYLILISAKDTLLRESHIYLHDGVAPDELKQDIKAYIESFIVGTKYALYLTSVLYCIFVILMFCAIFRLDFAYPFSTIFGLDYFYKVFSVI